MFTDRKKLKTIAFSLCAILLLCALPVRADAAEGRLCSLTWHTPREYAEELREEEFTVSLFRVAAAKRWDAEYVPCEGFEELDLTELNDGFGEKALIAIGEQTAELAEERESDAVITVASGEDFGKVGELLPGLYFVRMDGADTARWSYSGMSSLVFLPATRELEHTEDSIRYNEETEISLYYDLEIYGKLERERRLGDLVIEKTVDRFETMAQNAVAVFSVTVELDGERIYSNLQTLTFTAPGKKTAVVSDLPAGSIVTVKEIYSGAGFHLVGADSVTVEITATEEDEDYRPVQVSFKNEGGDHDGGTVVVNHFDISEGYGWKLIQKEDNASEWVNPLPEKEGAESDE